MTAESIVMTESKTSLAFPPHYGDFILQTSDAVLFHFPRSILAHMSPVFKDMFSSSDSNEDQPLTVAEESAEWECFLSHIDPKKPIPPFNRDTIVGLLRAADKYQVSEILQWFEVEVILEYRSFEGSVHRIPPIVEFPLLVLSLALQYSLEKTAQFATQELVGCPTAKLFEDVPLSLRLYRQIMHTREKRITWYTECIHLLAGYQEGGSWLVDDNFDPPILERDIKCGKCSAARSLWVHDMMNAVRDSPRWQVFREAFRRSGRCCTNWAGEYDELFKRKLMEAQLQEEDMPTPY